jgi:hypothetical protein
MYYWDSRAHIVYQKRHGSERGITFVDNGGPVLRPGRIVPNVQRIVSEVGGKF